MGTNKVWSDFDSVKMMLEHGPRRLPAPAPSPRPRLRPTRLFNGRPAAGVLKMFEENLKRVFPNSTNIQYSVDELYQYLDTLTDVSALTFQR